MRDRHRRWMWWVLACVTAVQCYQVWELLAALALLTLVFVPVAAAVITGWLLQSAWLGVLNRWIPENDGVARALDERSPAWPGSITSRKVA